MAGNQWGLGLVVGNMRKGDKVNGCLPQARGDRLKSSPSEQGGLTVDVGNPHPPPLGGQELRDAVP